jgi:hypothetical protein
MAFTVLGSRHREQSIENVGLVPWQELRDQKQELGLAQDGSVITKRDQASK